MICQMLNYSAQKCQSPTNSYPRYWSGLPFPSPGEILQVKKCAPKGLNVCPLLYSISVMKLGFVTHSCFQTHSNYLFPSSDTSWLNSHTYTTHCSLGCIHCELNVRLVEPQSHLSPRDSSGTVSLSPPIMSWRLALLWESELGEPACSGRCHVCQ